MKTIVKRSYGPPIQKAHAARSLIQQWRLAAAALTVAVLAQMGLAASSLAAIPRPYNIRAARRTPTMKTRRILSGVRVKRSTQLRDRHARRLACIVVVGVFASPGTALAEHVTSLQPWTASNEYRARVDLDGRTAPKLKPVARVNHVRAGQWVQISCQTTGESAYGSNVWSKVNGLFVPDHYLKTYTDSFIAGVPRCSTPQPPKPPATPAGPTPDEIAAVVNQVAFEGFGGLTFAIYKARYPNVGIIWDTNGCSVPKLLKKTDLGARYAEFFAPSCDRHDFGYRNYGSKTPGGLMLDPSRARRHQIDDRLRTNMDSQCRDTYPDPDTKATKKRRRECLRVSRAFYEAVHRFAGNHFR